MLRMMLRSCSTRLCLRLCISAVGAAVGSPVRNTAVPGTRWGGLASSLRTSHSSSASFFREARTRLADPRPQPGTTMVMTSAKDDGDGQRQPSPLLNLEHIGRQEGLFDLQ